MGVARKRGGLLGLDHGVGVKSSAVPPLLCVPFQLVTPLDILYRGETHSMRASCVATVADSAPDAAAAAPEVCASPASAASASAAPVSAAHSQSYP